MGKKENNKHYPEWIVDDRPTPIPLEIETMSEENIEDEFIKLFGKYIVKDRESANGYIVESQVEDNESTLLIFSFIEIPDTRYVDINGEVYRIKSTSVLDNSVTIIGRGDFIGKKLIFLTKDML